MIVLSFHWYLFNTSASLLHLSVGLSVYGAKFFVLANSKDFLKMMKSGVYFIVTVLLVAQFSKILIYAN